MSERVALLVVGAHRSGTSAITRLLNLLGARLPRDLMAPVEGVNARGFWESKEVQTLNDDALVAAGSAWDDTRPLPPQWFDSQAAAQFGVRIADLLDRHFRGANLFVLKDPRLCRLIPLWDQGLRRVGAEARFVHTLRNPVEVALSLAKAHGLEAGKSHMLWLRYTMSAERDSRGRPRAFTPYDGLLRDWRTETAKLSRDLRISWPRSFDEVRPEVERFLSPEDRHHTADPDAVSRDTPYPVSDAYKALRDLAALDRADSRSRAAVEALDSIRRFLCSADRLYEPIVTEMAKRMPDAGPGEAPTEEVEALHHENPALREELRRLRQRLLVRDFELDRRDRELRSLDRRVAESSTDLRSARRNLARLVRYLRGVELLSARKGGQG